MKPSRGQNEFYEAVISVRRVTKVVKGGRKFSFSVLVVVGDEKGNVGYGIGKHAEVMDAKSKAIRAAKKAVINVPFRSQRTLYHDISAKFCASSILARSAKPGTGIIAGGAIRPVFKVMGIKDVVAKSIGSSNPHNIIKALFSAFKAYSSPRSVAQKRGKKINAILDN